MKGGRFDCVTSCKSVIVDAVERKRRGKPTWYGGKNKIKQNKSTKVVRKLLKQNMGKTAFKIWLTFGGQNIWNFKCKILS